MQRASLIHEGIIEYQETVAGVGARNVHAALRRLASFAREPIRFTRRTSRRECWRPCL